MKPLVSILITAYNAEDTIAYTLQSAVAQTWPRKEIIVVDDGSTDSTAEVARGFKEVRVVSTENYGLSGAQNNAFPLSQGDYIQYLDADDLLAPDKIERQLAALREFDSKRVLLSSPWAPFYYRTRHARFVRNSLWQDLSPVDWLSTAMRENIHMQNATWLVSRQLAKAAGPWDTRLHFDQDGEYFCRVLLASEGTRFVPGTGIYYRASGGNSVSFIGNSDKKKDSLLLTMKLHIQYLRSLEDSERVRKACLAYIQTWCRNFYPERPDLMQEAQQLAASLGGRLSLPKVSWKYAWIQRLFGFAVAKRASQRWNHYKSSVMRSWDKALFRLEGGNLAVTPASFGTNSAV
ncbi:MAG TPA: glycosyltransferase family A protein [Acidobacteriota bacterium]|jgi:glycosyltransferase involved in cell wall biosynthesis